MSEEEKEKTVHEEDEQGIILAYPAWNKKNAPKDNQNKWEVPIYLWLMLLDGLIAYSSTPQIILLPPAIRDQVLYDSSRGRITAVKVRTTVKDWSCLMAELHKKTECS